MQTKDIIRQPLSTEWVITDPFKHVSKGYRNIKDIPEQSTIIGKLVSYNTYMESNHTATDTNHPSFRPTNTDKVKRFMVKYDHNGTDVYRVIEARDFMGTKAEAEVAWAVKRVERAEAEARRNAEQAEYDRLRQQAEATDESVKQAVAENILALFGPVAGQSVSQYYVRSNINVRQQPDGTVKGSIDLQGEIRIPVQEFLRLAERLANA